MMKRRGWLRYILCGVLCAPVSIMMVASRAVFAEEEAVSQAVLDNVSQNCSSIKQSLTDLQRADSRTRAYLGSAYETVARDFITPLNLRLVKNNRVNTELFEVQADFSSKQTEFRSEYTVYMRELESLIATDCQNKAESFYRQLEKTREHRAKLHDLADGLNKLVASQYQGVVDLKGEL